MAQTPATETVFIQQDVLAMLLEVSEQLRHPVDAIARTHGEAACRLVLAGVERTDAVRLLVLAIAHGWQGDWVKQFLAIRRASADEDTLRKVDAFLLGQPPKPVRPARLPQPQGKGRRHGKRQSVKLSQAKGFQR